MLFFVDLTLFAIHIAVILFNLFGWVVPKWRRLHLWVVSLTIFSWVILGFWFGFGYCFLTDFEWSIKRQLGETDLPNSFITYLTNNIFGLSLDPGTVDTITIAAFVPPVVLTVYFNFFKKNITQKA
ncbi:MAG: DUF2784 domain-containing protein [Fulvivirga sp.]|nr:DUF2784 domain-containing protein [Fulvivirga sp.]